RLVHALKYERGFHLLRDVEAIARANPYFTSFLAGAILVPVPLHSRKHRERGYNQAELLAQCLAEVTGAAGVERVVRRIVDTSTQTRLNRENRQENLKNAFALAGAASLKATQRYVLVDDVFTTGATLNACARVLRRSGLTRVDVATLGHG
ncbi:MAG: ComF family protein, partial [Opitutaceae bacterium]